MDRVRSINHRDLLIWRALMRARILQRIGS